jgi:hypothetical protein
MVELTRQRLLLDSTATMVLEVEAIDAAEAIKNAPARYSIVAFTPASVPGWPEVPGRQRAVLQGGPGAWRVAHQDPWFGGAPRR